MQLVGSQLGGYQVLEKIGGGGMGEVYRAVDRINRQVALKVIRIEELLSPNLADAQDANRRGGGIYSRNFGCLFDWFFDHERSGFLPWNQNISDPRSGLFHGLCGADGWWGQGRLHRTFGPRRNLL